MIMGTITIMATTIVKLLSYPKLAKLNFPLQQSQLMRAGVRPKLLGNKNELRPIKRTSNPQIKLKKPD